MRKGNLMTATEVCVVVGCSIYTLNNWYAFKKLNPDNEYAKMLPDFVQSSERGARYWNRDDIFKLIEFQSIIPKGRNGILGCITQRYYKKKEKVKNG